MHGECERAPWRGFSLVGVAGLCCAENGFFALTGFDVLLTRKLRPVLIEVVQAMAVAANGIGDDAV